MLGPDAPEVPDEIMEAVATVRLFEGLSRESVRRVCGVAEEISFRKGQTVFSEGDLGDKLYLILNGKVRISRQLPGMGEEALTILDAGEAFGEMALIDDSPRSADAHVHEHTRLLTLTRDAFEDLLYIHKDLAYEILWNFVKILSRRLRDANDKVAFMTITGRF